jgi:hypothetical protein
VHSFQKHAKKNSTTLPYNLFLNLQKKKFFAYASNIAILFLILKHMPYSVAIRFKSISSYYDHVYKIEELNYKEGW